MPNAKCQGQALDKYVEDPTAETAVLPVYKECNRPATVEHEGKLYCWQHNPNREDVRKRKTEEKDPPKSSTCVAPRCRNTAVMEFLGLRICERCYQKYVDLEERKFGSGRKWLGLPDHTPEEYEVVERYKKENS